MAETGSWLAQDWNGLPRWAWGGIAGAGAGLVIYFYRLRKAKAAGGSSSGATVGADYGSAFPGAGQLQPIIIGLGSPSGAINPISTPPPPDPTPAPPTAPPPAPAPNPPVAPAGSPTPAAPPVTTTPSTPFTGWIQPQNPPSSTPPSSGAAENPGSGWYQPPGSPQVQPVPTGSQWTPNTFTSRGIETWDTIARFTGRTADDLFHMNRGLGIAANQPIPAGTNIFY